MINILFASRHNMNETQKDSLLKHLGLNKDECNIVQENITWVSSSDVYDDKIKNSKIWSEIQKKYEYSTGVFPPVSLESKPHNQKILTPVSSQNKNIRENGEVKIEFVHLRWSELR